MSPRGVPLQGVFLVSRSEVVKESSLAVEGRWEHPICTGLISDSKVGDWLRKGKVLAPLVRLT